MRRGVVIGVAVLVACVGLTQPAPGQQSPSADLAAGREKPSAAVRELLAKLGIDDAQFGGFLDGRAITPGENPENATLLKILYRLPQFGRDRIEQWSQPATAADLAKLAENPVEHRGQFFRVTGRARLVERIDLPPDAAERFEFSHYFRVDLENADGAGGRWMVCARAVPDAWLAAESLDEPASVFGLFLKTGEGTELIFAADRMAWHPDREQPALDIGPSQRLLGSLGLDVGLFDDVRRTNGEGLGPLDREAFYQLLAATARLEPTAWSGRAEGPADLGLLLTDPQPQQGRLLRFRGNARQIQRIVVSDEDIRRRFGIDHYFQIDVFVPLGDQQVRIGPAPTPGEEAPTFRDAYPVTCCVRELPAGLPEAVDLNQTIEVTGVFFKLWSYRSEFIAAHDPQQRQVGPLFIAAMPDVIETRPAAPMFGWLATACLLAALAASGWFLWRMRQTDRRFRQTLLRHATDMQREESAD